MLFCKKMRPQVVAENPKLSFGEVGRKLGEMWRELSDEEKKKYK
jgi:DNA repair protein RAD16